MPGQIEYMHHAFLFGLALECLAAGNRLGERRGAAVHVLDGFPKLVNVIGHADHHSHHGERRHARVGRFAGLREVRCDAMADESREWRGVSN